MRIFRETTNVISDRLLHMQFILLSFFVDRCQTTPRHLRMKSEAPNARKKWRNKTEEKKKQWLCAVIFVLSIWLWHATEIASVFSPSDGRAFKWAAADRKSRRKRIRQTVTETTHHTKLTNINYSMHFSSLLLVVFCLAYVFIIVRSTIWAHRINRKCLNVFACDSFANWKRLQSCCTQEKYVAKYSFDRFFIFFLGFWCYSSLILSFSSFSFDFFLRLRSDYLVRVPHSNSRCCDQFNWKWTIEWTQCSRELARAIARAFVRLQFAHFYTQNIFICLDHASVLRSVDSNEMRDEQLSTRASFALKVTCHADQKTMSRTSIK